MPTYESIGNAENISCDWQTTAGTFDPVFSDRSIRASGSGYARMSVKASSQNVWFRTMWYTPSSNATSGTSPVFEIYSTTGVLLFSITNPQNSNNFEVRHRNAGSMVLGSTIVLNFNTLYMMDFHIVTSATTGRMEMYIDDNLVYNQTGLNNGTDPIQYLNMYALNRTSVISSYYAFFSEFLIGIGEDSPTVGRRIFSRFPAADSATNDQWTGNAAQINTGSRRTDGDMCYTDTAGLRQGFTISAAPVLNSRIEAVSIHTLSFIGDGSPRAFQHSARIGGVNYDQATIPVQRIPTYHETVFYTNPATSGSWNISSFNSAEWGFIST